MTSALCWLLVRSVRHRRVMRGASESRVASKRHRPRLDEPLPSAVASENQPRTSKSQRDSALTHGGTQDLEALDEGRNKLWKPVDRLWDLHQGGPALFVQSRHPGRNGRSRDKEASGDTLVVPAPRCLQSEDGHALGEGKWGRLRAGMRASRASLIRSSSRNRPSSALSRSFSEASRARAIGLLAQPPRIAVMPASARPIA